MKALLLITVLLLAGCSSKNKNFGAPNKDVCFLLFHLKTSTFDEISSQKNCETQLPPASTFKVPLAVMAFDTDVLKDESTSFKWDGVRQPIEPWNKDQTASTWMKESVVWVSQEITPKIGQEKIVSYLKSFEYGNANMDGGLKYSWLTPAPSLTQDNKNSLKISGFEQVHFLKNLWRAELKASTTAQLKTLGLLKKETSSNGQKWLMGKTGSGTVGANYNQRLGWWVGYLETGHDQYVVVMNFVEKESTGQKAYGGPEAYEHVKEFLSKKGLW